MVKETSETSLISLVYKHVINTGIDASCISACLYTPHVQCFSNGMVVPPRFKQEAVNGNEELSLVYD